MKKFLQFCVVFLVAVILVACKKVKISLPDDQVNISMYVGQEVELKPILSKEDRVIFTSNNANIASVDENGVILAIGEGVCIISLVASSNSKAKVDSTITVSKAPVDIEEMQIEGPKYVSIGKEISYNVIFVPSNASGSVTWSVSDTSIATISSTGVLTTLALGVVTIIAKVNDIQTSYVVNVLDNLTSINISGDYNLYVGEKITLTAITNPVGYINLIEWVYTSKAEFEVKVDGNKIEITALNEGSLTIKAVVDGFSIFDEKNIIAINPEEKVEIFGEENIYLGETYQYTYKSSVKSVGGSGVTWSVSDDSIASISSSGLLTPLKVGEVDVIANHNGVIGSLKVTINSKDPIEVVISGYMEVELGKEYAFSAIVNPIGAIQEIIWEVSNEELGSITNTGIFSGLKVGNLVIYAYATNSLGEKTNIYDSWSLEIIPPTIEEVKIICDDILFLGTAYVLSVEVKPFFYEGFEIIWSVSDEEIASIDVDGTISFIEIGDLTIYVSVGGFEANKVVYVGRPLPVSIDIEGPSTVVVGVNEQYSVKVNPYPYANQSVGYSVTNGTGSASVDASGVLTPLTAGSITLRVSGTAGASASRVINIVLPDPTKINISGSTSATLGTDNAYTASVEPSAALQNVTWSVSDSSYATINSAGVLTVLKVGVVEVIASIGSIVEKVNVTINYAPTSSINIEGASSVYLNSTINLTANILPIHASNSVTWSVSDTNILEVDVNGVVTGKAIGSALVICTQGSIETSKLINVAYAPATSILVSGEDKVKLGTTSNYTASVSPANASPSVLWSVSDVSIATINSSGVLTPNKTGVVVVYAKQGETVVGFTSVEIIYADSTLVSISGLTTVTLGTNPSYIASVAPTQFANQSVTWSVSDEEVATISIGGVLTLLKDGSIKITARSVDGIVGEYNITIVRPAPTSVSISGPGSVTLGIKYNYTASVLPTLANQSITWSVSDTNIATIDEFGELTLLAPGSVSIIAKAVNGVEVSRSISVVRPVAISVEISGSKTVIMGTTSTYTALVGPIFANQSVVWSVDNDDVASINAAGVLVPKKAGVVNIIARATGTTIEDSYEIEVVLPAPTSVVIVGPSLVYIGSSSLYTVTVGPLYAPNDVIWSVSDEFLVSIDSDGLLTAITAGIVKIRATIVGGTLYDEIEVTIVKPDPISLDINGSDVLVVGLTENYSVVVYPSYANQEVTWEVNDTNIAIINEFGVLLGVSEGEVLVSATTINGISLSKKISVVLPKPVSVEIVGPDSLVVGESVWYSAIVLPSYANQEVTWSILEGDTFATITSSGRLDALKMGEVVLLCEVPDSEVYDTLVITISDVGVSDIIISGARPLLVSEELMLTVVVLPLIVDQDVVWSSSNSAVAVVFSDGTVIGVSMGSATIKATAYDGYFVEVVIVVNDIDDESIMISGNTTVYVGTNSVYNCYIGTNLGSVNIIWSVSDEDIALIGSTGVLVAIKEGVITIKAEVEFGSEYDELIVNIVYYPPTYVEITGLFEVVVGEEEIYSSSVYPLYAKQDVEWKVSDETIASIDEFGKLTALKVGKVLVSATVVGTNIIDIIEVDIIYAPAVSVEIFGDDTIVLGVNKLYTAVVDPSLADQRVTWSVINDTGSATISSNGILTPVTMGRVIIKALTSNGKFDTFEVLIIEPLTISISIIGLTIVDLGSITSYSVTTAPILANKDVVWSVENGTGEATISTSGELEALKVGSVKLIATATDGTSIYGELNINIVLPTVISISIEGDDKVVLDESATYIIIVNPLLASKVVTWSVSDESIAIIDENGVLTALKVGTVIIYALTPNLVSSTKVVEIVLPKVESITLSGDNKIVLGTNLTYTVSILPILASKDVTWSIIDGSGSATISSNGVLTPISKGIIIVRVSANDGSGLFDEMEVEIVLPLTTEIKIEGDMSVRLGSNTSYTVNITPVYASSDVVWSVINGSGEGSINESGVFNATKVGKVIIKVETTDGTSLFDEIEINILYAITTNIDIEGSDILNVGDEETYLATTNIYADPNLVWSVSNELLASIDQYGNFTALASGSLTISVRASDGFIKTKDIIIYDLPESLVILGSAFGALGSSIPYEVKISPVSVNPNIVINWNTSNAAVATINNNGVLVAISAGNVTITATIAGTSISNTFNVEIVNYLHVASSLSSAVNNSFIEYLGVGYNVGVNAFDTIAKLVASPRYVTGVSIFFGAGSYTEAWTISIGNIKIYGPNKDIDGVSGIRVPEANFGNVITLANGVSNVEFNGLGFNHANVRIYFMGVLSTPNVNISLVCLKWSVAAATVLNETHAIIGASGSGDVAVATNLLIDRCYMMFTGGQRAIRFQRINGITAQNSHFLGVGSSLEAFRFREMSGHINIFNNIFENFQMASMELGGVSNTASKIDIIGNKFNNTDCIYIRNINSAIEINFMYNVINNSNAALDRFNTANVRHYINLAFISDAGLSSKIIIMRNIFNITGVEMYFSTAFGTTLGYSAIFFENWFYKDPTSTSVNNGGEVPLNFALTTKINSKIAEFIANPIWGTSVLITGDDVVALDDFDVVYDVITIPSGLSVTWVSGDESIVTIDANGKLTPIKVGSVTIYAISDTYVVGSKTIIIEYGEIEYFEIKGSDTVVLDEEDVYSVDVSPYANPNVVWSITNVTGSASIDSNGKVKGLKVGTVLVKATSVVDSDIYDEFEVTIIYAVATSVQVNLIAGSNQVAAGTSVQLTATVYPHNANQSVTWSSEVPMFSLITEDGLFTAGSSAGKVIVTVTTINGIKNNFEIEITITPEEIHVSGSGVIELGQTYNYTVVVGPTGASQSVIWSVVDGTGSATIDADGVLTPTGEGFIKVRATVVGISTLYHEIDVRINYPAPTSIIIVGDGTIEFDYTKQYNAYINPLAAHQTIKWSVSDESIATINSSGLLTMKKWGVVTITASDSNEIVFTTLVVTILEPSIEFSFKEFEDYEISNLPNLTPVFKIEDYLTGAADGLRMSIGLSSNPNAAVGVWYDKTFIRYRSDIGAYEIVYRIAAGTAVTALPGDIVYDYVIGAHADLVTDKVNQSSYRSSAFAISSIGKFLLFSHSFTELTTGTGYDIKVYMFDNLTQLNSLAYRTVPGTFKDVKTGNEIVAGFIRNLTPKTGEIFLGWSTKVDLSDYAVNEITVVNPIDILSMATSYYSKFVLASSVTLNISGEDSLELGGLNTNYTVTSNYPEVERMIMFTSSNLSVATITNNGVLSIIGVGSTTLTASVSGTSVSKTLVVNVYYADATNIYVSGDTNVILSEESNYTATFNQYADPNTSVTWSVNDPSIASIDQNGNLIGLKIGTVKVIATVTESAFTTNITDEFTVNIIYALETSVEYVGNIKIPVGETVLLETIVYPLNANQSVSWSQVTFSPNITLVDGKITGSVIGTYVLRMTTANNITNTVEIEIVSIATDVEIVGPSTIKLGTSEEYSVVVTPTDASTLVTWEVDKPHIATINQNGVLTAVSLGIIIITVTTYGSEEVDTMSVEVVYNNDDTNLLITGPQYIVLGSTGQYTYTINPLANPIATWSVIEETGEASISSTGELTPISIGSVKVRITDVVGGYKDFDVIIYNVVDEVIITGEDKLTVGINYLYTATITPSSALQEVTWSVNDTSIATINSTTGEITTLKAGIVMITATSVSGGVIKTFSVDIAFMLLTGSSVGVDGTKLTFEDRLYVVGISAFRDVAGLTPKMGEGATVNFLSGSYSSLTISHNNVTIYGPNKDIDPVKNLSERKPEAIFGSTSTVGNAIIVNTGINFIVINGLQFTNYGMICFNGNNNGVNLSCLYWSGATFTSGSGQNALIRTNEASNTSSTYRIDNVIIEKCYLRFSGDANTGRAVLFGIGNNVQIIGCHIETNSTALTDGIRINDIRGVVTIKDSNIIGWTQMAIALGFSTENTMTLLNIINNTIRVNVVGSTMQHIRIGRVTTAMTINIMYNRFESVGTYIGTAIFLNPTAAGAVSSSVSIKYNIFDLNWNIYYGGETANRPTASITHNWFLNTPTTTNIVNNSNMPTNSFATKAELEEILDYYNKYGYIVTDITIQGEQVVLLGDEEDYSVVTTPINAPIVWSVSDESIATIDQNGKLTTVGVGSVTVYVNAGIRQSYIVVVSYREVTQVTIDGDNNIILTKTSQLSASVNVNANPNITWSSSDESIAIVDSSGLVTALKVGTAIITATAVNGEAEDITITVVYAQVESVSIDFIEGNLLPINVPIILVAKVLPLNANQTVVWSILESDEEKATIDSLTGEFVGLELGEVTVVVSVDSFSETFLIEVVELATGVDISDGPLTVVLGTTAKYNAEVSPAGASQFVVWSVSDESIATIDEHGLLTPIKVGIIKIIVVALGTSFEEELSVEIIYDDDITVLINGDSSILVAQTKQYTVVLNPYANPFIEWSSDDDSIAIITQEGKLTAIKPGVVVIMAKAIDGTFDVFTITVIDINIDVEIIGVKTMAIGSYYDFSVIITPSHLSQEVEWSVDNTSIATIDAFGKLTAISEGVVKVFAETNLGSYLGTHTQEYSVNIVNMNLLGNNLGANGTEVTHQGVLYVVGESAFIKMSDVVWVDGLTLHVMPGEYGVDTSISDSDGFSALIDANNVTLKGPNAGISGDSNSRNPEAIFSGIIKIGTDNAIYTNITIDGIAMKGNPNNAINNGTKIHTSFNGTGGTNGLTIKNCYFTLTGTGSVNAGSNTIIWLDSDDDNYTHTNFSLLNNYFEHIGRNNVVGNDARTVRLYNTDGATITGNVFKDAYWDCITTAGTKGNANGICLTGDVLIDNNKFINYGQYALMISHLGPTLQLTIENNYFLIDNNNVNSTTVLGAMSIGNGAVSAIGTRALIVKNNDLIMPIDWSVWRIRGAAYNGFDIMEFSYNMYVSDSIDSADTAYFVFDQGTVYNTKLTILQEGFFKSDGSVTTFNRTMYATNTPSWNKNFFLPQYEFGSLTAFLLYKDINALKGLEDKAYLITLVNIYNSLPSVQQSIIWNWEKLDTAYQATNPIPSVAMVINEPNLLAFAAKMGATNIRWYANVSNPTATSPGPGNPGTFALQNTTYKFNGYYFMVDDQIMFMAQGTRVAVDRNTVPSTTATTAQPGTFRPYGSSATIPISLGIYSNATGSILLMSGGGQGVMYENIDSVPVTFKVMDTYGRYASGIGAADPFYRFIMRIQPDGTYKPVGVPVSATANGDDLVTLNPGDLFWCPMTMERNVTGMINVAAQPNPITQNPACISTTSIVRFGRMMVEVDPMLSQGSTLAQEKSNLLNAFNVGLSSVLSETMYTPESWGLYQIAKNNTTNEILALSSIYDVKKYNLTSKIASVLGVLVLA